MTNRVMRLSKNTQGRGFVVRVLEETGRDDDLGIINFTTIASVDCGTRARADHEWSRLRAEYGAR